MSNPSVCAVLLTADRQEYTDRAVRCFLSQTYDWRSLLIVDNGREPFQIDAAAAATRLVRVVHANPGQSIGALRNAAAEMASNADILMHWDSDDWSAPERMAHQVSFLQDDAGRDLTGFNSMLFYDRPRRQVWRYYLAGYCIGSSMAYWRKAWQRVGGFPDKMVDEDGEFQKMLNRHSSPSYTTIDEPLMICELHAGNTTKGKPPRDPSYEWTQLGDWRETVERKLGYV